jgi:hypothetical protein
MKLNETELNLSAASESVSRSDVYSEAMKEGFEAGARHVHDAVGILLFTYLVELAVWAVAHFWADKFKSEQKASEYYIRVGRVLDTGRVVILLSLFSKTIFTTANAVMLNGSY